MVTTAAQVVEIVTSGRPTGDDLAHAVSELRLLEQACARGHSSLAASSLESIAPAPQDSLWRALVSATAAMAAEQRPAWVAVCATAQALEENRSHAAEAVAIGYEIASLVVADLAGVDAAGWSAHAVADRIGAGATAARALCLPAAAVQNTLGLCATQSASLSMAEQAAAALQVGKASADAVEAAYLSSSGFTSAQKSLEGRRGLFALLQEAGHGNGVAGKP